MREEWQTSTVLYIDTPHGFAGFDMDFYFIWEFENNENDFLFWYRLIDGSTTNVLL